MVSKKDLTKRRTESILRTLKKGGKLRAKALAFMDEAHPNAEPYARFILDQELIYDRDPEGTKYLDSLLDYSRLNEYMYHLLDDEH